MRHTVLRITLVAYVAVLVAPAATVLPGSTWPLFAGGLAVGAVFGGAVTARADAAAWLSTVPRGVAGLTLPLLWLVPTADAGFRVTPWLLGATAVVPWLLAVAAGAHCRMRDRVAAARTLAEFEARPAPTQRRHLTLGAVAVIAVSVVVGVGLVTLGGDLDDTSTLAWLPGSLSTVVFLLGNHNERSVAVTDAGLELQQSLHEWDTFEAYDLTDEALTLSRKGWYRSELSFDREDIEDIDAVTAALEECLT